MLTKEQVLEIVEQHKGTIHTKEFSTRCGICRLSSTLLAAFEVVEAAQQFRDGRPDGADNLSELLKPFERKQGE